MSGLVHWAPTSLHLLVSLVPIMFHSNLYITFLITASLPMNVAVMKNAYLIISVLRFFYNQIFNFSLKKSSTSSRRHQSPPPYSICIFSVFSYNFVILVFGVKFCKALWMVVKKKIPFNYKRDGKQLRGFISRSKIILSVTLIIPLWQLECWKKWNNKNHTNL